MSTVRANAVLDSSGGNTATINGMTPTAQSLQGFRNRIINGDMRIDQRNAGTAVTTSGLYLVDRFTQAFGNASCSFQQVADAPAGFVNSLRLTVTTGAAPSAGTNNVILQRIEGLNTADLSFGSASASSVTLSFWVKASVTGTYATSLTNSAFNRSYVATYQVNSANTWEQKTVTIAGDAAGTWLTTNGTGIIVLWDFGSGSNLNTTAGSWQAGNFYRTSACTTIVGTTSATFQITGVQLEAGSVATPFERRDYGRELMMCQRYYTRFSGDGTGRSGMATGFQATTTISAFNMTFPVQMRSEPTATAASLLSSDQTTYDTNATLSSIGPSQLSSNVVVTHAAVGAQFRPATLSTQDNTSGFLAFSSEL